MNKTCTDLEQSQKFIELGIDVNTADMLHCMDFDGDLLFTIPTIYSGSFRHQPELIIPAWSLSALLDVLPSGKALIHDKESCEYKCICNNIDTEFYDNPIDACVEMILKLKENGEL